VSERRVENEVEMGCGCRYIARTNTIVRFCSRHDPAVLAAAARKKARQAEIPFGGVKGKDGGKGGDGGINRPELSGTEKGPETGI